MADLRDSNGNPFNATQHCPDGCPPSPGDKAALRCATAATCVVPSTPTIDRGGKGDQADDRDQAYPDLCAEPSGGLQWPPGFAGDLARFVYVSNYIPVKDIAIAAVLGFLAGVCGRAYRTKTKIDVALYIVLVARSGVGKDGLHEGIDRLLKQAVIPGAERFVRRDNFASGPALHKALLQSPGFLYLQGEWGRRLKAMADPRNSPMQDLRTIFTDAYGKSHLQGKAYSDAQKTLPGVDLPALSFLGETTPDTYLESLTPDMMKTASCPASWLLPMSATDHPLTT